MVWNKRSACRSERDGADGRDVMGRSDVEKEHLGDGVYVEIDGGMLKLTTTRSHGMVGIDVIYLEPDVMEKLQQYYKRALEFFSAEKGSA